MKHGDFSLLAKDYIHRTGYSQSVLTALGRYAKLNPEKTVTADVGAGTGKLTENLIQLGYKGFAIEPNDAMRREGIRILGNSPFAWLNGSGEETGLPDGSVDWVLMGSSFHWTDSRKALKEFHRILRPGGFFVALWNPRNLESSTFHMEIENRIHQLAPYLKRKSSGNSQYTKEMDKTLLEGGYFKDVVFMEGHHTENMSKERYLGAWKSVNDIRVQLGEEMFLEFLHYIENKIPDHASVLVPYKTRAWIAQATLV